MKLRWFVSAALGLMFACVLMFVSSSSGAAPGASALQSRSERDPDAAVPVPGALMLAPRSNDACVPACYRRGELCGASCECCSNWCDANHCAKHP